ncbi:acidic leucine-rich nuclear phosphoprotein 32-related [Musa troglodytarum]|uniref:Acidic leucine-rich nuclear phosphoprotein 32-related n=1 Tax=Musa troglodytarum TaxID=320322 RepID=A0A9E7JUL6_9LILI|nr:acidic leucine-rich nuclear phosphoprotein 32-related [Musa troglodytarum]
MVGRGLGEGQPGGLVLAVARSLTLDGSIKCLQGRLPLPQVLEPYQSLEHLSIANVGVSSLEMFPRLGNLRLFILSDNRIAGGLQFLDLAPVAHLLLASLDLYESPVTRIKGYRSRVFGTIRTLKYLDKMDADENERPGSVEEEDEEEDRGSGEVDGEVPVRWAANGADSWGANGIVDVDEEEESDAEDDQTETEEDEDKEEDVEDDDDKVQVEETYGEEGEEDLVEMHNVGDNDEDVDGVEGEGEEELDEVDEDGKMRIGMGKIDHEDVEDDGQPGCTGRLMSTEGDEDENGEIGEEDEQGVDDNKFSDDGDGDDDEDDVY